MPYAKGNKLWQRRSKIGRNRIFCDADLLWKEAEAYFEFCDENPWQRVELVKYQGCVNEAEVPLGRPYTIEGLTIFLGVSSAYFRSAKVDLREKIEKGKASEADVALLDAIELIEQTIRTQQIEGAAVGVFSHNLVARLNGLADNQNLRQEGAAVVRVTVRDKETEDLLAELDDLL